MRGRLEYELTTRNKGGGCHTEQQTEFEKKRKHFNECQQSSGRSSEHVLLDDLLGKPDDES